MATRPGDGSDKLARGLAGTALILVVVGLVAVSVLRFFGVFERTVSMTVRTDRVGLVMDDGAKVTSRGVEIGKVTKIRREGDHAEIELAIRPAELRAVPANAPVHIGGNTIFGAKTVSFEVPAKPSSESMQPGTVVPEASVTTEVNNLFERLTDLLQSIEPQQLNATLGALSNGLNGRGDDIGAMISELNRALASVNPHLGTLGRDLDKGSDVANLYADAAPDVMRLLDSGTDVGQTLVGRQENFEALLANAIAAGNSGKVVLDQNGDNVIKLMRDLRSATSLLAEYSPAVNCMIIGLDQGQQDAGQSFGATGQAGLSFLAGFQQGAKPYRYPDDLPKVNAKSGPQCYNLLNAQRGTKAPFLDTDVGTSVVAGMPNSFKPDPNGLIGPAFPPNQPAPPSILQFMLGQTTAQYAQPSNDLGVPGAPAPAAPAPAPASAPAAPAPPAQPGGGAR